MMKGKGHGGMTGMKDDKQIAGKTVGGGSFGMAGMTEKNLARPAQDAPKVPVDKQHGSAGKKGT